ncbi:uncharacterized protein [Dysidea avara]|uniref:uncharacterized protein n=1 Tax=Dysidea avara TaxID=196820 RepID=UPI00332217FF
MEGDSFLDTSIDDLLPILISKFFLSLEHIVFGVFVIVTVGILRNEGFKLYLNRLWAVFIEIPGVKDVLAMLVKRQVKAFVKETADKMGDDFIRGKKIIPIPEKGLSEEELMADLEKLKKADTDPHSGTLFAYSYHSEGDKLGVIKKFYDQFEDKLPVAPDKEKVVQAFFTAFMNENALNPLVFPSLRRFEVETVAMAADMLHGDANVVGSVTSGGTESILCAIKTYRDRARNLYPYITQPEMVAPATIHPAFMKAAGYFDVKIVTVPLTKDYQPDLAQYEMCINKNTILLLASACEYTHGIVDPVEEIADIASKYHLPLHVDACFGGFILPWVEKLGYEVPVFDFRIKAVTSMSADIHKYGLGMKGASVVLYRNSDIRKYQVFAYTKWVGGLFGSPGVTGTRPGGIMAASWAILKCMGQDGYLDMARKLMAVTNYLKREINAMEDLQVLGTPHCAAFAVGSTNPKVDVFVLADLMEGKGWKLERAQKCIHFSILPAHTIESTDRMLDDLRSCIAAAKMDPSLSGKGSAAIYGMAGKLPNTALLDEFVAQFFNEVYSL